MIGRLKRFLKLSPTRRWQRLGFAWAALVTRFWYGPRLLALGRGSIIQAPLFWTPEYIAIGNNVLVWPGCRLEVLENELGNPGIHIADGVTIQQNCHITAASTLHIGAGATILANVVITDIDHRYDDFGASVVKQPIAVAPTTIGRNCFIGAGAMILANTYLGEHCVVGANAVVRGTFPAGSVIVGNPSRIVKRYDEGAKRWTAVKIQEASKEI